MLWVELLPLQTDTIRNLIVGNPQNRSMIGHLRNIVLNAALATLINQPFWIASRHACLLASNPACPGFLSTVDAIRTISSVSPLYLWSGTLERFIYRVSTGIVYFVVGRLIDRYCPDWRLALFWLPAVATEVLTSPLRVLASQTGLRTPWLLSAGYAQYSPSLPSHIAEIWTNEGLAGFYRGLLPILTYRCSVYLAASLMTTLATSTLHQRNVTGSLCIIGVTASVASFVYDLRISERAAFPLGDIAFPPSPELVSQHALQRSL